MPTLKATLAAYDIGLLRILAGFWGLDPGGLDAGSLRAALIDHIHAPDLVEEVVEALPGDAAAALGDVLRYAGRMPWARMTRLHGDFRQMGEARRAREQPHLTPVSAVEALYYRGLIGRAFLESEGGPQEYAFVPDDLLPLVPHGGGGAEDPPGRPAADPEYESILTADDRILDLATTLLSAARSGVEDTGDYQAGQRAFLTALLVSAGPLADAGSVNVGRARTFLEAPRARALLDLFTAWRTAPAFDDMALVPHLEIVVPLKTDPVRTRARVLAHLTSLPRGVWWSIAAFTAGIHDREPDFLRPTGSLDNRYVRDRASGEFLDGSANWDAVEGALIRWLLAGPLHWLGLVDLGWPGRRQNRSDGSGTAPLAFRTSTWMDALLDGRPPDGIPEETEQLHVRSDGRIGIPRLAPRAARYLVARFCEWEPAVHDEYRYRATPSSLARAGDQGLRIEQLITLLARHAVGIPPNITLALKSWGQHGRAARIEHDPILRLPSAEALEQLQASRAARFLGDVLGPAAVAIQPGSEARVLAALNELGYLAEIVDQE